MFRFTIRDVLWLTVVVGVGVGWWVDRVRLNSWFSDFADVALREAAKQTAENVRLRGELEKLKQQNSVRSTNQTLPDDLRARNEN